VKLGVASYSLRNFPREKAIEMRSEGAGRPIINLKSIHPALRAVAEEVAAARREIRGARALRIVGGGVITFEQGSDADVGKYFAYAQAAACR